MTGWVVGSWHTNACGHTDVLLIRKIGLDGFLFTVKNLCIGYLGVYLLFDFLGANWQFDGQKMLCVNKLETKKKNS